MGYIPHIPRRAHIINCKCHQFMRKNAINSHAQGLQRWIHFMDLIPQQCKECLICRDYYCVTTNNEGPAKWNGWKSFCLDPLKSLQTEIIHVVKTWKELMKCFQCILGKKEVITGEGAHFQGWHFFFIEDDIFLCLCFESFIWPLDIYWEKQNHGSCYVLPFLTNKTDSDRTWRSPESNNVPAS